MSLVNNLFDFINESHTAYHTVYRIKSKLLSSGFTEIFENDFTELVEGEGYFITRGDSSIIAFRHIEEADSFLVAASHSDSPTFRIKSSGEKLGVLSRLDVEKYGGFILYSWFDRPLGIAGRVLVETEDGVKSELVTLDTTVVIPSVAPHLNREVNTSFAPNLATDLLPIYSLDISGDRLIGEIADKLGVEKSAILSYDLSLYNKVAATTAGVDNELIVAPRLDNLESVSASLEAFLATKNKNCNRAVPVFAVFDNEEVGSATREGAASTFLYDVLSMIAPDPAYYKAAVANGFMLSIDCAHALHPAHPELSDAENRSLLGSGISVKYSASHLYTTDGMSEALLRLIAKKAGAPLQRYANRADMLGGSTLGSIASTKVPLLAADIGLPILAMHSSTETGSCRDYESLVGLLTTFYSSTIERTSHGYRVK